MVPSPTQYPWDVYQEHLFDLGYGLPVWDPSPKRSLEIIEGSVVYPGVAGTFSVLFNTRKAANDTRWQPHGVPRGFKTLDEEFERVSVDGPNPVFGLRGWNCRSVECTREASGDLAIDVSSPASLSPPISAGGGFKLTCKKSSGALLALQHNPLTTYIESSAHITTYIARHHASWLDMANSQSSDGLGLGLKAEDLYFVSGTTKVPQWFIGVFNGGQESERGGHLECTVTNVFNLTAEAIDIQTVHRSPVLKKGPMIDSDLVDAELPWDQCIFLHYFKVKRRRFRVPTIIKGAAGPDQLPGSEPEKDPPALPVAKCADDMEVDIEEVIGRSKILDPVDGLLEYILEDAKQPDLAIASDNDVSMLFPTVIPRDLRATLLTLKPLVMVDEHGAGRIDIRSTRSTVQAKRASSPSHPFYAISSEKSRFSATHSNAFYNPDWSRSSEASSLHSGSMYSGVEFLDSKPSIVKSYAALSAPIASLVGLDGGPAAVELPGQSFVECDYAPYREGNTTADAYDPDAVTYGLNCRLDLPQPRPSWQYASPSTSMSASSVGWATQQQEAPPVHSWSIDSGVGLSDTMYPIAESWLPTPNANLVGLGGCRPEGQSHVDLVELPQTPYMTGNKKYDIPDSVTYDPNCRLDLLAAGNVIYVSDSEAVPFPLGPVGLSPKAVFRFRFQNHKHDRQVNVSTTVGGRPQPPTKARLAILAAREMERFLKNCEAIGRPFVYRLDELYLLRIERVGKASLQPRFGIQRT